MEAEDIKKMAARMSVSEPDVSLAVRASKGDVAEAEKLLAKTVVVVKATYAAKTNRMNGSIVLLVDTVGKKVIRSRAIATYDTSFAEIPLSTSWKDIERKVLDAEIKENFVPAISHDLAGEIEYSVQENMADYSPIFSSGDPDDISTRIRRVICTCLGDSDVDCNASIEKITPLSLREDELKEEAARQPEEAAPEGGAAAQPSQSPGGMISEDLGLVLKTDVVLSPVAGVAASTLNPGDYILVKITDNRPQANYICNLLHAIEGGRPVPVRVPIRKIDRSESQRLVITTEFGPGVLGRTVVQESLKLKCSMDGSVSPTSAASTPKGPIVLIVLAALVVLGLLLVVIYFMSSLI